MRALLWSLLLCSSLQSPDTQALNTHFDDKSKQKELDFHSSYHEVLRELIRNWDSPIAYFKEHGYLPDDFEDTSRIKPNLDALMQRFDKEDQLIERLGREPAKIQSEPPLFQVKELIVNIKPKELQGEQEFPDQLDMKNSFPMVIRKQRHSVYDFLDEDTQSLLQLKDHGSKPSKKFDNMLELLIHKLKPNKASATSGKKEKDAQLLKLALPPVMASKAVVSEHSNATKAESEKTPLKRAEVSIENSPKANDANPNIGTKIISGADNSLKSNSASVVNTETVDLHKVEEVSSKPDSIKNKFPVSTYGELSDKIHKLMTTLDESPHTKELTSATLVQTVRDLSPGERERSISTCGDKSNKIHELIDALADSHLINKPASVINEQVVDLHKTEQTNSSSEEKESSISGDESDKVRKLIGTLESSLVVNKLASGQAGGLHKVEEVNSSSEQKESPISSYGSQSDKVYKLIGNGPLINKLVSVTSGSVVNLQPENVANGRSISTYGAETDKVRKLIATLDKPIITKFAGVARKPVLDLYKVEEVASKSENAKKERPITSYKEQTDKVRKLIASLDNSMVKYSGNVVATTTAAPIRSPPNLSKPQYLIWDLDKKHLQTLSPMYKDAYLNYLIEQFGKKKEREENFFKISGPGS